MAKTPVSFLKEVQEELKKVVWPKREDVIRLTVVVVIISLIVGSFLGIMDMIFTEAIKLFLNR